MKTKISDIKIGPRHRKHLGDLGALAASIKAEGLLQPIGITETNELVFGYRRLRACQMAPLWWEEIETRVVKVTDIINGEFAENEMRKDFTPSERVAIMETINSKPRGRNYSYSENLPNKTEAAKLAGFGNSTTAREARHVVYSGVNELVEAVDRGEIAVNPASIIAREPPAAQQEILKRPDSERRKEVKSLREKHSNLVRLTTNPELKCKTQRMVTIPYRDVVDKLRPLIKRVKEQSKRHAATVSFTELSIIAHELAQLADAWTENGTEPGTHSDPVPFNRVRKGG